MVLAPGTRLGPYEVVAPMGAEEEGRYKATDTRRNQAVTIKVLPPEFSANPSSKARLERTARTISSLKHPQICALVDVGHEEPSTDFVVAEFVEGDTLAVRLAQGPLDLPQALRVAVAVADSLDKAHRKGVIHGGLNPSVVVLAPDGPKLLDFGVAAVAEDAAAVQSVSMATTMTSLSTLSAVPSMAAPYMAPEQYAGGAADARTDIFAFGTVLYQMVTGRPAFQEKTQALLVAAIQTVDPEPASKAQRDTPPALDYVITRCLAKDPRQRFQTAFDVLMELQFITSSSVQVAVPVPKAATRKRQESMAWAALGVVAIAGVALTPSMLARFQPSAEPEEARFVASSLPAGTTPVTVSPDGRWVMAAANGGAAMGLPLDSVTPQTLVAGNPFQPFWSPDARSIAYVSVVEGKLMRADIGGGPPQVITDLQPPISAGTWNQDGIILVPSGGLIQRVLAAGGQLTPVTALDQAKQETEHVAPVFLPDGRRFLFLAVSSKPDESAIYVSSLDSPARTRLFASDSRALYAAPGYLLFNRGDTVFAQAFDAESLALTGEPVRVASGVTMMAVAGSSSSSHARWASFGVSQTGVLAYRAGGGGPSPAANTTEEQRSLFWFDRAGQRSIAHATVGGYTGLELSPDGSRAAVHRHQGGGGDSWIVNLAQGAQGRMQRFTFDALQDNGNPIWSPDGTRIAFASTRGGRPGIYVKAADGTGAEEAVVGTEVASIPMSWSSDSKLLVYSRNSGNGDIWAVPVTGDKKPFPLVESGFAENFAQVSPDGKWLAYQSNETGRPEIYVKPFPEGPGKWQVSTDGGQFPRWRGDSAELFFYFNNNVISAAVRASGASFEAEVPKTLFGLGAPGAAVNHPPYHRFDVTADGRRFLISQQGEGGAVAGGGLADAVLGLVEGAAGSSTSTPNSVTVILNWTRMLK
jgi:Tol biopolymer transport system component